MKLEHERLLSLDVTPDELAKNRESLDKLPINEKIEFASKLIALFPIERLGYIKSAIEALRHPRADVETFYEIITKALEVRFRIETMWNVNNPSPYRLLLVPEFNQSLYAQFTDLCNVLFEQKTPEFAERLAKLTPKENLSELSRNINLAFGERSPLAVALEHALTTTGPGHNQHALFSQGSVVQESSVLSEGERVINAS